LGAAYPWDWDEDLQGEEIEERLDECYMSDGLSHISNSCGMFMRDCLSIYPNQRPTAENALEDNWFYDHEPPENCVF
jgi:serine/threonine protein kinase